MPPFTTVNIFPSAISKSFISGKSFFNGISKNSTHSWLFSSCMVNLNFSISILSACTWKENGVWQVFISFTPMLPNSDWPCTTLALFLVADNFACIFFPMDIPLFNIFIERETSFPFIAQLIFSISTAAIQILALSPFLLIPISWLLPFNEISNLPELSLRIFLLKAFKPLFSTSLMIYVWFFSYWGGVVMVKFTNGRISPSGRNSLTVHLKPLLSTFSSIVKPGTFRSELTL